MPLSSSSSSSSDSSATTSSRDNPFLAAMKVGEKVGASFDTLFEKAGLMDDASTPSGSSTSGSSSSSESKQNPPKAGLKIPPMSAFNANDEGGNQVPDAKSLSSGSRSGSSYSSYSGSSGSSRTPSRSHEHTLPANTASPPQPEADSIHSGSFYSSRSRSSGSNSGSRSSGSSRGSSYTSGSRTNRSSESQRKNVQPLQSNAAPPPPPPEEDYSGSSSGSYSSGSRSSGSSGSSTNSVKKPNQSTAPPPPPPEEMSDSSGSSYSNSSRSSGTPEKGGPTKSAQLSIPPPPPTMPQEEKSLSNSSSYSGSGSSKSSRSPLDKPQTSSHVQVSVPPPPPGANSSSSGSSYSGSGSSSRSHSRSSQSGSSRSNGSSTQRKSPGKNNVGQSIRSSPKDGSSIASRSASSRTPHSGPTNSSSLRSSRSGSTPSFSEGSRSANKSSRSGSLSGSSSGSSSGSGSRSGEDSKSAALRQETISNQKGTATSTAMSPASQSPSSATGEPMTVLQRIQQKRQELEAKKAQSPSSFSKSTSSAASQRATGTNVDKKEENVGRSSTSPPTPALSEKKSVWVPPVLDFQKPDDLLGLSDSASESSSGLLPDTKPTAGNDKIWVPPPLDLGIAAAPDEKESSSGSGSSGSSGSSSSTPSTAKNNVVSPKASMSPRKSPVLQKSPAGKAGSGSDRSSASKSSQSEGSSAARRKGEAWTPPAFQDVNKTKPKSPTSESTSGSRRSGSAIFPGVPGNKPSESPSSARSRSSRQQRSSPNNSKSRNINSVDAGSGTKNTASPDAQFKSISMDGEVKNGGSNPDEKKAAGSPSNALKANKPDTGDEGSGGRWLPPVQPALTNFGNKDIPTQHVPGTSPPKLEDVTMSARSEQIPSRTLAQPVESISAKNPTIPNKPSAAASKNVTPPKLVQTKKKKDNNAPPPVEEIEVDPAGDDESSLGSMGWLFTAPQNKSRSAPQAPTPRMKSIPPRIDENDHGEQPIDTQANRKVTKEPDGATTEPVIEKPTMQSPTVISNLDIRKVNDTKEPAIERPKMQPPTAISNSDIRKANDDYYKSWILPGREGPRGKPFDDTDRKDPPGSNVSGKPPLHTDKESNNKYKSVDQSVLASATWTAPSRTAHGEENDKAFDSWVPTNTYTGAPKALESTRPVPIRSDSFGSDWAPPGMTSRPIEKSNRSISTPVPSKPKETQPDDSSPSTGSDSSKSYNWSWVPPSTSKRVDYTGRVNSERLQRAGSSTDKEIAGEPWTVPPMEDSESSEPGSVSSQELFGADPFATSMNDVDISDPEDSDRSPQGSSEGSSDYSSSRSESESEDGHAVGAQAQQVAAPGRSIMKDINFSAPQQNAQDGSDDGDSENKRKESVMGNNPLTKCCLFVALPLAIAAIILTVVFVGRSEDPNPNNGGNPFGTNPPTAPPSAMTTDLLGLILSFSPGSAGALNAASTPQRLALDWLSDNQFLATYSRIQRLQRFTMAVLFYSSAGEDWDNNDLWLSDIDECDWHTSEKANDVCNPQEQLVEIDLRGNGLQGTIPWQELSILGSQLTDLTLSFNTLAGRIQSQVSSLASLRVLNLKSNSLTGEIPTQIGRLTNARILDLSQNSLVGTIPAQLGGLLNLQSLYLSGNGLTGSVPNSICALGLETLEVDCNLVSCSCCTSCSSPPSGTPPAGPPSGSPGSGDAIYQFIVGSFPSAASALEDPSTPQYAAIEWLRSPANNAVTTDRQLLQRYALATLFFATQGQTWSNSGLWLTPDDECTWYSGTTTFSGPCDADGNYVELNLRNNNLQGGIPPEISLFGEMKTIKLEGNELSGSIPNMISQLSNLEELNLSANQLFGIIPSQLGTMTALQRLVFFDNNLFSTIPTELGQLNALELLDLGSNQLTGQIPTTLGNIESLAGLSVFNNFLSGSLPSQFSNLSNLQLIYVDDNDIGGPIPQGVCDLDFEEFWADCEETQCLCCTTCCSDGFGCV